VQNEHWRAVQCFTFRLDQVVKKPMTSSAVGQSRHFSRRPAASGLPRSTDILRVRPHASNVPKADIGVIVVRQLFDPGAAEQRTTLQAQC
jgi:hypothetical protein